MTQKQPVAAGLVRQVNLPREAYALLKNMGVEIPPNFKEIQTEVEQSDAVQRIVLPKGMSKLDAAEELKKQHQNEEQIIDIRGDFEGWNWKDVLVAIKRTTEEVFGWIHGRPTWFTTPTEIDIVVDYNDGKKVIEKAFYNGFKIGPWEDASANVLVDGDTAGIIIKAKKKYTDEVTNYFNLVRTNLETRSIYRGRNIVVKKNGEDSRMELEIIENKATDLIILNKNTRLVVDNFVLGSLEEGGKRTFLFTGNYGNGKTEIACQVGREAVERHNMSFFYVKDATLFEEVLVQSMKYQPCIIFLEDIDEIAAGDQRDASMNSILNTLDGVQTKGNNITTIFTTNHPERINSALRRPGRIDLVVEFTNPDEYSKMEIMRRYFEGINGAAEVNYEHMADAIPPVQGAVVAEICKRAVKLSKQRGFINHELIESSIASMQFQIKLMNDQVDNNDEHKTFFSLWNKFIGDDYASEARQAKMQTKVTKIAKAVGVAN